jgi:hypothetical protein
MYKTVNKSDGINTARQYCSKHDHPWVSWASKTAAGLIGKTNEHAMLTNACKSRDYKKVLSLWSNHVAPSAKKRGMW